MPNFLSTNPGYFCRNAQCLSKFYSNLPFSLFFLSFESLSSSRFWQKFFAVCKCLHHVALCKHLCFSARSSDFPLFSVTANKDPPYSSLRTIFLPLRSLQAQKAPECFQHFSTVRHLFLYSLYNSSNVTAPIVPPCSAVPLPVAFF